MRGNPALFASAARSINTVPTQRAKEILKCQETQCGFFDFMVQEALQSILILSAEETLGWVPQQNNSQILGNRCEWCQPSSCSVLHTLPVQVIPHRSWSRTENLWCPQSLCCNLSPCIYLCTCRHSCCRGFRDLLLQRSKMLLPAIPLIWRRASITQLMASRHNSSITFSYWLFLSTLPCNEDLCLLTFTQQQHQLSPNPATHKNGKRDAGKH